MNRTLTLKVFVDPKTGLSMTVTHAETDGDEGATEKHSVSGTDSWGTDLGLKEAAGRAVEDYLGRLRLDAKKSLTPIEKAIDETVRRVNAGELDRAGMKVTATKRSRA